MRKAEIVQRIAQELACTTARAEAAVGRNPKTGAVATIAARRVVRFTAGQPFKQAVDAATHRVE